MMPAGEHIRQEGRDGSHDCNLEQAEALLAGVQGRLDEAREQTDWDEVIADTLGHRKEVESAYFGHDMRWKSKETGLRIACDFHARTLP